MTHDDEELRQLLNHYQVDDVNPKWLDHVISRLPRTSDKTVRQPVWVFWFKQAALVSMTLFLGLWMGRMSLVVMPDVSHVSSDVRFINNLIEEPSTIEEIAL